MQIKVEAASELDADRLRTLRLAALSDSPNAFGAKYEVEKEKLIFGKTQPGLPIGVWYLQIMPTLD
jgi:hypothetical protein